MNAADEPQPASRKSTLIETIIFVLPWAALLTVVIIVAVPGSPGGLTRGKMTTVLANAHSFLQAVQMMSLDQKQASGQDGFPADLGVKSFREYVDLLTKDGYLSTEDVAKMHLLEDFALVNASWGDPPRTALLVTRSFLDPRFNNERVEKGFVVFQINGSGGIYTRVGDDKRVALPNRQPQILPRGDSDTDSDRRPMLKWAWG